MKPTPPGWPRISPVVFYRDARAAIDWLVEAFGFELRMLVEGEGGTVEHSELSFGPDGLIMVGSVKDRPDRKFCIDPAGAGGKNTQSLCVHVEDVDAFCAKAQAVGAVIASPPETHDYGPEHWADRTAEVVDLEGHHWWFIQRMHTGGV